MWPRFQGMILERMLVHVCSTCATEVVTPGKTACCVLRVFGVVLQLDGATTLFGASQSGHVECVRALLDRGAAINQAMVGCQCAWSMAWHCVTMPIGVHM